MEGTEHEQSVVYLTILIVLQILIFIFMLVAQQQETIMTNVLRLLLLIAAHCMKSVTFAAYYAMFALFTALYIFDPVGLWITGHGEVKSRMQNGFCVLCFICIAIASYLGYLYKKTMDIENDEDLMGDADPDSGSPNEQNQNLIRAGENPSQPQNQYLYRAGENQIQPKSQKKGFQQFAGQGYSLG